MEQQEILSRLCVYDSRNPDNCFYGRDKLALEILRLQQELQSKYEQQAGEDL